MPRYMLMHKTNAALEAGQMPPKSLIAGVGQMVGEMSKAGVLRDGAGLRQSALGVRLKFAGGKRTVTKGPYTGGNELTAGLCVVSVRSIDEAIDWATRFAAIIGGAEIDLRPVTEAWDLGFAPKPEGLATTRYMAVLKADARFESGARPSQAVKDAVAKLIAEMKQAGVFQNAELMQPSRGAKRLRLAGGKITVTDGPFTESKELISGFVLLALPSMDEAMTWARRYAPILGDVEMDVRVLEEPGAA